jgi:branched-subunit amino acid aminotransferase/4-amino-4-deoxychorismate lyase
VEAGRVRFAERHVARLVDAARALRLGDLEASQVRRALAELAEAAFGAGTGVVRLQVSRDGDGRLHLVGVPRPLGREPLTWSAIVVRTPGTGAALHGGLKVTSRLALALAGDAARRAGADEALIVDASGHLVEGSRSNLLVVTEGGEPRLPPLARGGVDGIARRVALERVEGLRQGDVDERELARAREIVALNAVRGARPVTRVDGNGVGDGRAGPWARRLAEALRDD